MSIISRLAIAAGLATMAMPATAATFTYSFHTVGEGFMYSQYNPDPYTPVKLVDAIFQFTVETSLIGRNADGSYELFGTTNGHADSTGLSIGYSASQGSDAFSGGGTVCFGNSGGGFILAPARIQSTCQSPISASGWGSQNGLFKYTGVVTTLTVAEGGGGSLVPNVVNGVPEPATWALMLTGFALTGYALRRRRTVFASV